MHDTIADGRRRNEARLGVVNDTQPQRLRLVAVSDEGTVQGAEVTISIEIKCRHAWLAAFALPTRLIGTPQRLQAAQACKAVTGNGTHSRRTKARPDVQPEPTRTGGHGIADHPGRSWQ